MEEKKELPDMLDLMIQPGFFVKDYTIVRLNAAAKGLLLHEGMDIRPLILTGLEEYLEYCQGCLYLRLALSAGGTGASITKAGDMDVFVLENAEDDHALRALALAARELREPLATIMVSTSALRSAEDSQNAALLNRGVHQLLRIIGNMSDAGRKLPASRQENTDITSVLKEVFQKAADLASAAGVSVCYQEPEETVICLADREQLERAVLNLLSNALKFTPAGGTITASLTRRGKMLRLSICDSGCGIAPGVMGSVFSRYLRQPCIEDGRFGLGLGMVLVRAAATNHGGAVLIDQPDGCGTRITMTLAIRRDTSGVLRSPILRVDYAGEQDHALVELADCLPADLYKKEN